MLQRVSTHVLIGCLFLGLAVMGYAQDVENMIVTNNDFDVDTNGWSLSAMGGNVLHWVEPGDGPEGPAGPYVWAQIVDVGPEAWNPEIHSPTFNVKNGKQYTVSFWAMAVEGDEVDELEFVDTPRPLSIKFEQLDTWTGPSTNITITGEWAEYSYSPNMTMGSPPAVVIHFGFDLKDTDVLLDHFRVYEGEYVDEGLVFGEQAYAVHPRAKLATSWAQLKTK